VFFAAVYSTSACQLPDLFRKSPKINVYFALLTHYQGGFIHQRPELHLYWRGLG